MQELEEYLVCVNFAANLVITLRHISIFLTELKSRTVRGERSDMSGLMLKPRCNRRSGCGKGLLDQKKHG